MRRALTAAAVTATTLLAPVLAPALLPGAGAAPDPSATPHLSAAPDAAAGAEAIGAVVWSDEFNGAAGTGPDPAKWRQDVGGGGWGNNEMQYYTPGNRNAAHNGQGQMVITAKREGGYQCHYGPCQYTSARLLTKGVFDQAYGRFEARIKLPRGQGIWPAFWMLGNNIDQVGWPETGEIDILENIGREPNNLYGTLHGPGYSAGDSIGVRTTLGQPLADNFRNYAVEWEPGQIRWYIDGREFGRLGPADLRGNRWVFDHPFFMILNVAVGGFWPGYPDATTQFPQQMLIDWVRVSRYEGGGSTPAAGRISAIGKCLDVAGGNSADGTRVQSWECNGSAAQQWSRPGDGTIRALGKCLDVAGGGTADGTAVQLATCSGNPAQQWAYSGAQDLVNPQANKCLDIAGGNTANGTRVQIWPCNGQPPQKWTVS